MLYTHVEIYLGLDGRVDFAWQLLFDSQLMLLVLVGFVCVSVVNVV